MADQVRESGGSRRVKGVQGGVIASGPDGPAEGPGTARTAQNGLNTSRKRKTSHHLQNYIYIYHEKSETC